jgi:hypothetical protein
MLAIDLICRWIGQWDCAGLYAQVEGQDFDDFDFFG